MRIIIAEDEQRSRQGLRDMILSLPEEHEVVGMASNGQKALELIQLLRPDVVFTDIRMPYMGGLELIRASIAQKLGADFVVTSAFAEFDYAKECISLGVTEYLVKPLILKEVSKTLERIALNRKNGDKYNWEKSSSLSEQYPEVHILIKKVLDIIENSFSGRISQKELAASLGVSSEYLSYLFKKETGENFAKFVRNYRIEVAKKLLRNKSINPEDVPYMVGFSDAKYFKKVFCETVGLTVHQFRHFR